MNWFRLCISWLLLTVFLLLSSCSARPKDPRLLDIAQTVSDHPREALALLDSIDPTSLKENDRNFYELLQIKATDKAYILHTSDSMILKVIDYYSKHKGCGLYPEALYYAGRVYSDIGDYPTALRYFQDALDALPENPDLDLKSKILTQKGWILHSLRMYKEAIKNFEESLKINSADHDSIKYLSNMKLLGAAFLQLNEYNKADSCFMRARKTAKTSFPSDTITLDMYLAGTQSYRGNTEAALKLIRPILPYAIAHNRHIIMSYAANIYLEAGILDSAYYFAKKLMYCDNLKYQKTGYRIILLPELRNFSPTDSLISYIGSYRDVLDKSLDNNDSEQVLMQTSLFNYQLHERELKKAEVAKTHYMYLALIAIIIGLFFSLATLYFRKKSIRNRLQYHEALDDIEKLRKELTSNKTSFSASKTSDEDVKTDLRNRLKEELLALQKTGEAKKDVPQAIIESDVYSKLQEYVTSKKRISDSDNIWTGLETAVLASSPSFKSRLYLLAGDRLKEDAYHLALLIKCGVSPTTLSILTGRTKGAISSRRGDLCNKIFGEKLGATLMDDIIRLL